MTIRRRTMGIERPLALYSKATEGTIKNFTDIEVFERPEYPLETVGPDELAN
jgi:adenylylsulfate kinase-like enzyme